MPICILCANQGTGQDAGIEALQASYLFSEVELTGEGAFVSTLEEPLIAAAFARENLSKASGNGVLVSIWKCMYSPLNVAMMLLGW